MTIAVHARITAHLTHPREIHLRILLDSAPSPGSHRSRPTSQDYPSTPTEDEGLAVKSRRGVVKMAGKTVPCEVCGGLATGNSYNVYTCEACKSFFFRFSKRERHIQLKCQKGGRCSVNWNKNVHRWRCQYCRFQTCLLVGMTICDHSDYRKMVRTQPKLPLTVTLLIAHHDTYPKSPASTCLTLSPHLLAASKELGWHGSDRAKEFATKVLCVEGLEEEDKQTIIKYAVPELLIIRLASRFVAGRGGFAMAGGEFLPVAVVVEVIGLPLAQKLIQLATLFMDVELDEVEFCFLCGLTVALPYHLCSSSHSLTTLERYYETHLEALVEYETKKEPGNVLKIEKMLLRMADIWALACHAIGRLI